MGRGSVVAMAAGFRVAWQIPAEIKRTWRVEQGSAGQRPVAASSAAKQLEKQRHCDEDLRFGDFESLT
jgi:hypothetical protein